MARRRTPPPPAEPPEPARVAAHVAPAALGAPPAPPTLLEYRPTTAPGLWRVERFDLLCGDLGLPDFQPETMAQAHALLQRETRLWTLLRELYGIQPVIPPSGAQHEAMRRLTAEEVCTLHRLSGPDLAMELDAARGLLRGNANAECATRNAESIRIPQSDVPRSEDPATMSDDELLEHFLFPPEMFLAESYDRESKVWKPRSDVANRAERLWFANRVRSARKMLAEPMASMLTRSLLTNELHMMRIETEISRMTPGSPRYGELSKTQSELQSTYQEQLTKLNEIFPWSDAIGGKVSFLGCISDLVRAVHEYEAKGDNALIDKIHTQAELEILCRTSQQIPLPRYRLGQVTFLVEALSGLHDPHYRSLLKKDVLRALDAAGQAAILASREDGAPPPIDLESDDPSQEYPDLKVNNP